MAFDEYKKILEEEKTKLETELAQIADMNPMMSDQSEMANVFEEMERQAGLEYQLEERHKKVSAALKRIEDGAYGICSVCKKPIEEKRLKANPIAKNCIKHAVK